MWFISKHQLPCIIDARQLGSSAARQLDSSTDRQGGQPGGKGSHGRCAVARFSKHPRPDLIKTCGPAELQLDSSTARQVGQPGGKGSHGRCAVARLSKHPRPDLAKYRRPSISREKFPILTLSACPRLDSTAIKDEEAPQGASFSCLNNSEDCFLLHLH